MDQPTVTILQDLARAYRAGAPPAQPFTVQFEIEPEPQCWHVRFDSEPAPTVEPGASQEARFTCLLSRATLERLVAGDLAPLTAAGRTRLSEPAPLDFRLPEGLSLTPAVQSQLIDFAQRFFNPTSPQRVRLGEDHTRPIHGGHAVAMFYGTGFRSAWYLLQPGERLNAPGDTDPFAQAFVFLSGRGRARIGDQSLNVQANEAYYVPPGAQHIVWNDKEQPLTLLYLAWGEGA